MPSRGPAAVAMTMESSAHSGTDGEAAVIAPTVVSTGSMSCMEHATVTDHEVHKECDDSGARGEEDEKDGEDEAPRADDLRHAVARLSRDFSVDAPGHPRASDVLAAATAMLKGSLPEEYEADEDELGRSFYYNKMTGTSSWCHPFEDYYRGWLFMHRGKGRAKTDANALANPSTPDEIRQMAAFYGVDPAYVRACHLR